MAKGAKGGLAAKASRVASSIKRLFSSSSAEEEVIELPREAASDSLVDDSFTLALEGLLAEDDGRGQVKLHLISLVEFREAVGSKWGKISEKVMLIAEGVINMHLGPGNVFGRKGPDLFVLIFRNTPESEARRRAVRIALDLGTRLVGSQFTGSELPLALAAEISVADATAPYGVLNLEALNAAVGETRAVIADQASDRPPFTAPEETSPRRPDDPDWAAMGGGRRNAADPSWEAMERRRRAAADPQWQVNTVEREQPPAIDPGLDPTPPMPADSALSMGWRPTWMAEGEVIGAYRGHMLRVDSPDRPAYEGSRAYPTLGGETVPKLDRFAAAAAARGIKAMIAEGGSARVIVPLHWDSLSTTARNAVLAPLADIPEQIRGRVLMIDLFGLPAVLKAAELTGTVNALRPLCREVILRLSLRHPRIALAAEAGLGIVGVDLAELPDADKSDDEHLLAALENLRAEAAEAEMETYVWSVRRRRVVTGTVLGGFAMMNGPGLMRDLPRPAKVLPAPRSRFAQGTP